MGSTRSSSGVSSSESERIRSRLRGKLRDVKIRIPQGDEDAESAKRRKKNESKKESVS